MTGGNAGENLSELLDRIGRMARGLQFAHGLNPAQWESLRFLACANRHSRTPSALATFLGTTKGTASQTLIALESKGLISRARSRFDRRVTTLVVTQAGEDLLRRDPLLSLESAVAGLPRKVATGLVDGLSRLIDELTQRHGWQSFGICVHCGHFQDPQAGETAHCGKLKADLEEVDTRNICVYFESCAGPTAGG